MLLYCLVTVLTTLLLFVDGAIITRNITYNDPQDGSPLKGFLAYPSGIASKLSKLPVVLIVHDWNGLDNYERRRARMIAEELGWLGFAVDVYGNGATGSSPAENRHLMAPFMRDRAKLLRRLKTAYDYTLSNLGNLADKTKVGAMGYCFGGTSVIDMARGGLPLNGVVSFHGGLSPISSPNPNPPNITSKLLILTGYNDPSIPPKAINDFEGEMTKRKADFEVNIYSDTVHSFTVPHANVPGRAEYNKQSDERSWCAMKRFFKEVFQ